MPYHLIAMLCGIILILIASYVIVEFEHKKGYKGDSYFKTLFSFWIVFVAVFQIQPKLKKYINTSKFSYHPNGLTHD